MGSSLCPSAVSHEGCPDFSSEASAAVSGVIYSVWWCILIAICVLRGDLEGRCRRGKPTWKGKIVWDKDWVRQGSVGDEEVNRKEEC